MSQFVAFPKRPLCLITVMLISIAVSAQHNLPIDFTTHRVLYQAKIEFPGLTKDELWKAVRRCIIERHHNGGEKNIEYSRTRYWGQNFKEDTTQYWMKQRANMQSDSIPVDIYFWEAYSIIDGLILVQIRDFTYATRDELATIRGRDLNNWSWDDIAVALKPLVRLIAKQDTYHFHDVDEKVQRMLYEIELLIRRYVAAKDYELYHE